MAKPLQEYIQEYLETTKLNNEWLGSEIQKCRKEIDPDLKKANELHGRASNQLQKIKEMRLQLIALEQLCRTLHVDIDKVVVGD